MVRVTSEKVMNGSPLLNAVIQIGHKPSALSNNLPLPPNIRCTLCKRDAISTQGIVELVICNWKQKTGSPMHS